MRLFAPHPALRLALTSALSFVAAVASAQVPLGLFEHAADVGAVLHPGATKFDSAAGTYTVTGSGENMWFGQDQFQFVWKKAIGDLSLAADIHFVGTGGNKHRKAVLMIRRGLDPGSPAVLHPGATKFDSAAETYTVTGSGENMWFGQDQFQFVWKKATGDLSLAADIHFLGTGGNKHRKAVLMIRRSLDPGSPAVDIALHGDGLTSLQFRDAPGENTHEIEFAETAPHRVELQKRGDRLFAFVSGSDGKLHPAGAAIRVPFSGDFYVGLGVSAHDKDASETAVFSHVVLQPLPASAVPPTLLSVLETVNVASTDRRVAYRAITHFEAPNWSRDGSFLLVNQSESNTGRIVRLAWHSDTLSATDPEPIDSAPQLHLNNDHGLSPDGSQLAVSDNSNPDHNSRVYVLPVTGGTPREITPTGPSYWHGWSPDGQTLAFVGQRSGEFDIYTVPVTGGPQTRLTTAKGLDDGPEYSPDGNTIFFCSVRSGHMQLWRMHPDGSEQEQLLTSETDDWFPHVSPDGKLVAFVAFPKNTDGHPPNKDVEVRILDLATGKTRTLAKLFGGQGTLNVPSWSPDSARLAFVSYQLLPPEVVH